MKSVHKLEGLIRPLARVNSSMGQLQVLVPGTCLIACAGLKHQGSLLITNNSNFAFDFCPLSGNRVR